MTAWISEPDATNRARTIEGWCLSFGAYLAQPGCAVNTTATNTPYDWLIQCLSANVARFRDLAHCAASFPPICPPKPPPLDDFLGLNAIPRKGWTRVIEAFKEGKNGCETVAQHSTKTAFLAAFLCPEAMVSAFELGLLHDHAEQVLGDLTPSEVPDRSEKKAQEGRAYQRLVENATLEKETKTRLLNVFRASLDDSAPLTRLLHAADKLDMVLQALAYEEEFGVDLTEFLDSAAPALSPWPGCPGSKHPKLAKTAQNA